MFHGQHTDGCFQSAGQQVSYYRHQYELVYLDYCIIYGPILHFLVKNTETVFSNSVSDRSNRQKHKPGRLTISTQL